MKTGSYKDLLVWQKSISLVKQIYQLTETLPQSEKFGLSSQIRRAAVSIPSNIAEGYGRNYQAERRQFLALAVGSARELETQLLIVRELDFDKGPNWSKAENQLIEILKMLSGLSRSLH